VPKEFLVGCELVRAQMVPRSPGLLWALGLAFTTAIPWLEVVPVRFHSFRGGSIATALGIPIPVLASELQGPSVFVFHNPTLSLIGNR